MVDTSYKTSLNCPQCGAKIPDIEESGFIVCPYCESTLYVDLSKVIQHFYYPLGIKDDMLEGILVRWLSRHELNHRSEIITRK